MKEENKYTVEGFPLRLSKMIYKDMHSNCVQVANLLGIERKSLYRYLDGESSPNLVLLKRMCDLFGCSADWLIYGDREK